MLALTELQQEILTELLNIGVGSASATLSTLLNSEISLSVPQLVFITQQEVLDRFNQKENLIAHDTFTGDISGDAFLLFTEAEQFSLTQEMLHAAPNQEIDELDLLQEVANIVIHNCLGSLSNNLKAPLELGIPRSYRGHFPEEEKKAFTNTAIVLYVDMNFAVKDKGISGFLSLMMDTTGLNKLKIKLDAYMAQFC